MSFDFAKHNRNETTRLLVKPAEECVLLPARATLEIQLLQHREQDANTSVEMEAHHPGCRRRRFAEALDFALNEPICGEIALAHSPLDATDETPEEARENLARGLGVDFQATDNAVLELDAGEVTDVRIELDSREVSRTHVDIRRSGEVYPCSDRHPDEISREHAPILLHRCALQGYTELPRADRQ